METSGVEEVKEINDRVRFVQIAIGEHGVVHALDEGGDVWRFKLAKKFDRDGEVMIHAWHRMEQARVIGVKREPTRALERVAEKTPDRILEIPNPDMNYPTATTGEQT